MSDRRIFALGGALSIATVALAATLAGVGVAAFDESNGAQFVALLVVFVASLVVLLRFEIRKSGDRLSLLVFSAVVYFLAFGVGAIYAWFALRSGVAGVSHRSLVVAMAMAVVAWIGLAAGFMGDPFRVLRMIVPPPRAVVLDGEGGVLIAWLLVIGWSARLLQLAQGRYFHIQAGLGSQTGSSWFVDIATLLPLVAAGLAGAMAFGHGGRRSSRRARLIFWLLVASEFAWAIPTGAREKVIDVLVLLVVVRYYARGRLPSLRTTAAVAVVLVFLVFPIVGAYRSADFRSSPGGALAGAVSNVRGPSRTHWLKNAGDTLARFADVTAVARIVDVGRGRLAFSTADTVAFSVAGFVPRAVFPDKNSGAGFGNQFGRAYGFLSSGNLSTSIAVTQPGELYLGGGWVALLLGMPIIGGILKLLDTYLLGRTTDAALLGVYAIMAPTVAINLETSIPIGLVGALKATAFLVLVTLVLGALFQRPTYLFGATSGRRLYE